MVDETPEQRAARTAAPHRRPRPEVPAAGTIEDRVAAEVARRLATGARRSAPTIDDDPVLDPEQRIPPGS